MRKFYLKQLLLAAAFLFAADVYSQCTITRTITGNATVCQFTTETYTTQTGMTNYVWSAVGGGVILGQGSSTANIQWGGPTGSVTVTYTDTQACTSGTTKPVTIKLQAPTPLVSGPGTPCSNVDMVYTTDVVAGAIYNWSIVEGTIVSGNGTSSVTVKWNDPTINPGLPYPRVDVSITDANKCPTVVWGGKAVTVSKTPAAPTLINGTLPNESCQNIIKTYNSSIAEGTYSWSAVGGTIQGSSTQSSVSVKWTTPGAQAIKVRAQLGVCNSDYFVKPITVWPTPVPTISGAGEACINSVGSVYTTESGKSNYTWGCFNASFTTPAGLNTRTLNWGNSSLNGTVSVGYTDDKGCSGNTTKNVIINYVSNGGTIAGTQQFCAPPQNDPAVFTEVTPSVKNGSGTFSYQWQKQEYTNYIDIAGATAQTYDPPLGAYGTFRRKTSVVFNGSTCFTNSPAYSNDVYIHVNTVNPGVLQNQTVCIGDHPYAEFTGYAAGSPSGSYSVAYQWQSSTDGVNFSDISGATNKDYFSGTLSTTMYYKRKITSGGACSQFSNVATVTVLPLQLSVTPTTATICPGGSATLTSSGGLNIPYNYTWSTQSTQLPDLGPSLTVTPSSSTTYYLSATTANGCRPRVTATVSVIPAPINSTIAASATSICLGQSVTISSTGGNGTKYYWASTNGGSSWNIFAQQYEGQSSFSYTPTQAGTYRFQVRNSNSCSFSSGSFIDITVNPGPLNGSITASATSMCMGQSVNISSSGGSGTPYYWATSDGGNTWNVFAQAYGGQSVFNWTPTQPGTYTFYVYRHNSCGFCWDTNSCSSSPSVTVTVSPGPTDGTIYASSSSISLGQSVTISSYGSGDTPYYWASTNGGASWNIFSQAYGGQSSFSYTPIQPGTYLFHVRNANACGFCWQTNSCAPGSLVSVEVVGTLDPFITSYYDVCYYGYTILTANGTPGADSYTWSTGETSQSIYAYPGTGYYVYANYGSNSSNPAYYTVESYPCMQMCYDGYGNQYECIVARRKQDGSSDNSTEEEMLEEQSMLGIYPNPANTEVTVEVPVKAETKLDVIMVSQLGHTVLGSSIQKGEVRTTLDTRNLTEGVYIVLIKSPKGTMLTQKVFVKH